MKNIDLLITLSWTIASAFAVVLAVWALARARSVCKESKRDLNAVRHLGIRNGRMVLAAQQASETSKLLWIHRGVLIHQAGFLLVGIWTLFHPSLPPPEDLPTIRTVVIPAVLVLCQFVIVGTQVLLVSVTFGQERAMRSWQEKRF